MLTSLIERDKQVIWHPYTQMQLAPNPLPIVKGKESYLIDQDGRAYIDAISSWWVCLHGHGHPYLAEKIYRQALELEQVIFAGCTHEPAVRLAERLLDILPGPFSRIFYSDNGSTAVEVALKMAIQYWKNKNSAQPGRARKKILALTGSYHGDTFGAMSVSERGAFTLAFEDYLFDAGFIDIADVILAATSNEASENTTAVLGSSSAGHIPGKLKVGKEVWDWNEIACFIYEPMVQGAGGMRMYEAARLNQLLALCKQHDVICIADEVMTGFGRTGKLFASGYLHPEPDIICLSKGLTGGMMALGVTACTQAVYEAFLSDDRAKTFFHGHSYTANPIACAAGNASLDLLLKEECLQNIQRISQQQEAFALQLANGSRITQTAAVRSVRCLGTILAFEVEAGGKDGYLNNISSLIHKKALEKGVFIRPLGNTVYIMPPYCTTAPQLQEVYDCLTDIIAGL